MSSLLKLCPEHGIMFIRYRYCSDCGRELWTITEEEHIKSYDFVDKKTGIPDAESHRKWIEWLKSRHPEFK